MSQSSSDEFLAREFWHPRFWAMWGPHRLSALHNAATLSSTITARKISRQMSSIHFEKTTTGRRYQFTALLSEFFGE